MVKRNLSSAISTRDLIKGRIDFHIHPGPDPYPRVATAFEIATLAHNAGMKAIVFKCFEAMTPQLADTLQEVVPDIRIVGGVCMEGVTGGINPRAVEMAIRAGAKVVWMPSLDSAYNEVIVGKHMSGLLNRSDPERKLRVTKNGKIIPEVKEIFEMVAEANIVVETGHMFPEDKEPFIKEAIKKGVKKIVLTHVNAKQDYTEIEDQKKFAQMPGVYFEYAVNPLILHDPKLDPKVLVEMIRAVSPERAVLGTDCGVSKATSGLGWLHPTEGLACLIGILLNNGISKDEIDIMSIKVPSMLLDL